LRISKLLEMTLLPTLQMAWKNNQKLMISSFKTIKVAIVILNASLKTMSASTKILKSLGIVPTLKVKALRLLKAL
jgi:hypothetical protein